jgi:HD-GYP domain-containing protein (c-di-GMP phosphodiesterase class II)
MIVDTVDAMNYKRPYNTPVPFSAAAAEVRRCTGTQFDPSVVEQTLDYLANHLPVQMR